MVFLRDPADRRFRHFCETGDPGALGDVFDLTAGRLLRVAVWLAGNRTDAEDLLQRTFLKAIETRAQFRRGAPVLPWLMGLLGNEARRLRRDRDRAAALRPPADRVVDPETDVIANELAATVRAVGERLAPPYRDVLRLHLELGLGSNEIAARLGRPEGTVRTQLMRALDLLRRRLPAGFAAGLLAAAANASAPAVVRAAVVAAAREAGPIPSIATATPTLVLGALSMKKPAVIAALAFALLVGAIAFVVSRPAWSLPAPPDGVDVARVPPPPSVPERAERDPAVAADRTPAPTPTAVTLPRMHLLGALSVVEPAAVVDARGVRLGKRTGTDADVLLRVDRAAPWLAVVELLEELRERGVATVRFACETSDGAPGCFTIALPTSRAAGPTFGMRLHRERDGVPPWSHVPVLRRIVHGRREIVEQLASVVPAEQSGMYPRVFTLGVTAPADAPFEQVLQFVAAASQAGVEAILTIVEVATDWEHATRPTASVEGPLAVDLGPSPRIAIRGRSPEITPSGVSEAVVGCAVAPDAATPERQSMGAGGRYGSRGSRSRRAAAREPGAEPRPDPVGAAFAWLAAAQQPDGCFLDDRDQPDPEATALVAAALLADGTSIYSGGHGIVLAKCVGWLLDSQRDDGCFATGGSGALRHHALATLVLAEAYGLDVCPEVRGALQDAVAWLAAQRQQDGGFASDVPGFASDVAGTAVAALALSAAEFFRVTASKHGKPVTCADVCKWFDGAERPEDATSAAAQLFARFLAKQIRERSPELDAEAEELVQAADPSDPWTLLWTSYATFQVARQPWKQWSRRLDEVARQQIVDGDLAGSWAPAAGCSRVTTTALRTMSLLATSSYTRMVR